jgi:hypothetical protein
MLLHRTHRQRLRRGRFTSVNPAREPQLDKTQETCEAPREFDAHPYLREGWHRASEVRQGDEPRPGPADPLPERVTPGPGDVVFEAGTMAVDPEPKFHPVPRGPSSANAECRRTDLAAVGGIRVATVAKPNLGDARKRHRLLDGYSANGFSAVSSDVHAPASRPTLSDPNAASRILIRACGAALGATARTIAAGRQTVSKAAESGPRIPGALRQG